MPKVSEVISKVTSFRIVIKKPSRLLDSPNNCLQ